MKATPSTRKDSLSVPPTTFFTPIIFRSRVFWSSLLTASTTILAKKSFSPAMSLEFKEVMAHLCRTFLFSSSLRSSIVVEKSLMKSVATLQAFLYAATRV